MNLPNLLSLSRIGAVFVIAGLLFGVTRQGAAWATGVFVLAALTDALDGWLARRLNQVTVLGKFLDALVDKIFMQGVFMIGYYAHFQALVNRPFEGHTKAVHDVLMFVILLGIVLMMTREFSVTGLRIMAAQKQVVMAAERGGKIKTVLQMLSGGLFIFSLAWTETDWFRPLAQLAFVLFLAAVVQTVLSGVSYFRNYGYLILSAEKEPQA